MILLLLKKREDLMDNFINSMVFPSKHIAVSQGSEEWHHIRLHRSTASNINKIYRDQISSIKEVPILDENGKKIEIFKKNGDPFAKRKFKTEKKEVFEPLPDVAYVTEKINNYLFKIPEFEDLSNIPAIANGKEKEPIAIDYFSKWTGIEILECGIFVLNDFFAGSPDGISKCGKISIEVKCPQRKNFNKQAKLKTADDLKKFNKDYWLQCHCHNLLTGSEVCKLITYNDEPKYIDDMFVIDVPKDPEVESKILYFVDLFGKKVIEELTYFGVI